METEKQMEYYSPSIFKHIAIGLNHSIMVIGGFIDVPSFLSKACPPNINMYLYNLYTEKWRFQNISGKSTPSNLKGACGVSIGKDIFTFGGEEDTLQRLSEESNGHFVWSKITVKHRKHSPSPRYSHSGWEYEGKLWIFGGRGPSPVNYLNDYGDFINRYNNQLLHFNPSATTDNEKWTNVKSTGTVPSPRCGQATTALGDNVWMYGGASDQSTASNDLYELNMRSLTWTHIQTGQIKPHYSFCSLNATTDCRIVLHGAPSHFTDTHPSFNDTWVLDLTTKTWQAYTSRMGQWRQLHTGSQGIHNSIVIIGGGYFTQFHRFIAHRHSKCVFKVMLEPKSLKQLAIQIIHKHQHSLPWRLLPKKLSELLHWVVSDLTALWICIHVRMWNKLVK